MLEDEELLLRWRDGDVGAGEALFERYFDALARFFRSKVNHGVEDLVQQTFVGCIAGVTRLRDAASFRSFLFATAHNTLRATFRAQRRRPEPFDPAVMTARDFAPGPSSLLAQRQEQRLLLEGLRTMPLDAQVLLELFYWEDMTSAEIAEVMGAPHGTIRSRLRRARELLRERLRELSASPQLLASTLEDLDGWAKSLRSGRELPT
ncbi:MAG: sigma-70 family RNA polymerase sigma factor [Myxococcales bacterium]|nr:sigma-70 family RNA polymerase sigma factor [Myxococcales bacterium]